MQSELIRFRSEETDPDPEFFIFEDDAEYRKFALHQCPTCGYVAGDISQGGAQAVGLVRSPAYQAIVSDDTLSDLVKMYRCATLLEEWRSDFRQRPGNTLISVFAYDNAHQGREGLYYRLKAAALLQTIISQGECVYGEDGYDHLVLSDMYRRCAQFEIAIKTADSGLLICNDELIRRALLFEKSISARWDTLRYRFEDVPKDIQDVQDIRY
jgi:hypothetical protein